RSTLSYTHHIFFSYALPPPDFSTLSLHDALPISRRSPRSSRRPPLPRLRAARPDGAALPALLPLRRSPRSPRSHRCDRRDRGDRSEEHTSELQSPYDLVCRLLLEKKKHKKTKAPP